MHRKCIVAIVLALILLVEGAFFYAGSELNRMTLGLIAFSDRQRGIFIIAIVAFNFFLGTGVVGLWPGAQTSFRIKASETMMVAALAFAAFCAGANLFNRDLIAVGMGFTLVIVLGIIANAFFTASLREKGS